MLTGEFSVCIHTYIHTYIHTCLYVCMLVCLYVCMYVCMYACMHTYIHVIHSIHTWMYVWDAKLSSRGRVRFLMKNVQYLIDQFNFLRFVRGGTSGGPRHTYMHEQNQLKYYQQSTKLACRVCSNIHALAGHRKPYIHATYIHAWVLRNTTYMAYMTYMGMSIHTNFENASARAWKVKRTRSWHKRFSIWSKPIQFLQICVGGVLSGGPQTCHGTWNIARYIHTCLHTCIFLGFQWWLSVYAWACMSNIHTMTCRGCFKHTYIHTAHTYITWHTY